MFIAPDCVFSTAGHPLDAAQRNQGLEIALPITVGNNVWIGTHVSVLPGVTIGNNVVIGAGSVVNRDIPDGVVAAGNPCRVIKKDNRRGQEKNIQFIKIRFPFCRLENQNMKEGQVFYADYAKPEGFCDEA